MKGIVFLRLAIFSGIVGSIAVLVIMLGNPDRFVFFKIGQSNLPAVPYDAQHAQLRETWDETLQFIP